MTQRFTTVAIVLLVLLSVAVQAVYLASPTQPGLPLDDGWIHAAYARNLARTGQLCLHPGEPSTGTTSFLWTALLALLRLVGLGPVAAPLVLAVPLQAWLAVLVFLLVRDADLGGRWAFLAAASCALLGNLVWISLAGMEATLFLVLGLSAVWCRRRGRLAAAGILAGLLVLTRPEGAALALAMALPELPALWRRDFRRWPVWLKLFAPVAAAAAIYLAINLAVTGTPLTSTFAGRRWLAGQPARIDLSPLAIVRRLPAFAESWLFYLGRWVFGMVLLLWLGVEAPGVAEFAAVALCSLFAGVVIWGLLGLIAPPRFNPTTAPSALRLLLGWAAVHNAAYVVLLPVPGHAGRYQAVNFVVLAILIAVGAAAVARLRSPARRLAPVLLALWLALAAGSTLLWRVIYRDSVDHIHTTHVACGRWIAEHLPPDAVVATYDLGAIAYFADRRVVDLGGLVDPAMARHLFAGDSVPYLRGQGVTHLAMIQHSHKDSSLLEKLGIHGKVLLRPLHHWQVDPQRYHLHHAATSNAKAQMWLYRIDWRRPPAPD